MQKWRGTKAPEVLWAVLQHVGIEDVQQVGRMQRQEQVPIYVMIFQRGQVVFVTPWRDAFLLQPVCDLLPRSTLPSETPGGKGQACAVSRCPRQRPPCDPPTETRIRDLRRRPVIHALSVFEPFRRRPVFVRPAVRPVSPMRQARARLKHCLLTARWPPRSRPRWRACSFAPAVYTAPLARQ